MFVRAKSTRNSPRRSVQIVESIRDGKKVRQPIVRHVGVALSEHALPHLRQFAEFLCAQMKADIQPSLFRPEDVAEQTQKARALKKTEVLSAAYGMNIRGQQFVSLGIHDVYGDLY